MSVRVEQLSLLDPVPSLGGEGQQGISPPLIKTRKPKKNMELISKYKVNVNGISIPGVIDYITPGADDNVWLFTTSDGRKIEACGGILVEEIA